MKMKNLIGYMVIIMLSLFALSCEGEEGSVGPQGPQGEQGTQGAQGDQGEQGETGSANVIYSDWVNTELDNNIVASTSSFDIEAPQVNANMLNFGTILVYGRRIDVTLGNVVYQLPIVFGAARQQSYYYRATQNNIRITVAANEQGESVGDGSFLEQYRYILIPGGEPSSRQTNVDYSEMSYSEIAEHFNIQD